MRRTRGYGPLRIGDSSEADAGTQVVEKAAHGFTVGKWITIGPHPQAGVVDDPVLASSANYLHEWLPIGVVIEVLDVDRVRVAHSGLHYLPELGYSDGYLYYLSTSGNVTGGTGITRPDYDIGSYAGGPKAKTARTFIRMTHVALGDGWVWIHGPVGGFAHNHLLSEVADVDVRGVTNGQTIIWNSTDGVWRAGTPAVTLASLGDRAALSVVGRAANSVGPAADIVSGADDQVFLRTAGALTWSKIGTANVNDLAITSAKLADVIVAGSAGAAGVIPVLTWNAKGQLTAVTTATIALDDLSDVSITSHTTDDIIVWNGTAWVDRNIGKLSYDPANSLLGLDGGTQKTIAFLAHADSRLVLSGSSGTCPLDFKLANTLEDGTDISARIRGISASQVSFYDQATPGSNGTEVVRWDCSATASARLWYFKTPFHIAAKSTLQTRGLWAENGVHIDGANSDWVTPSLGATYRIGSLRLGQGAGISFSDGYTAATTGVTIHGVVKGATGSTSGVLELGIDDATYGVRLKSLDGSATDARDVLVESARNLHLYANAGTLTGIDISGANTHITCKVNGTGAGAGYTWSTGGVNRVTIAGGGLFTTSYGADLGGAVRVALATSATVGFYGSTGATQQTVTGSRGGNAALASLLTALASLGLIVNSTTA